jgi:sodium-dependent dicarboxylate transporter 2/3/5
MWMSNTATTAIMVATVLPLVRKLPPKSNLGKALMLAIPFSANIGGIATPIGTTPNAIAIGLLAEEGTQISFVAWMLASFPVMLVTLGISFGLLMLFFPTRQHHFSVPFEKGAAVANRPLVYTTFFVTIALWLTDVFHRIPAAIVALVPVAVFSVAGQLPKRQLREIPWDILLLIGGGLALGVGVKQTGLGETIVGHLLPSGLSPLASQILVCFVVTLLGTFMSHTAATNIILPLALTVATAFPAGMAIPVAICASFGMALPVSTPPNAIAYGSELIDPKDMLKVGALISVVGIIVTVMYSSVVFRIFTALFSAGK